MSNYTVSDTIRYKTLALFAEHFGISPARVSVTLNDSCVMICAERFLQPIVESLIHEGSHGALQSTRELMVGYLMPNYADMYTTTAAFRSAPMLMIGMTTTYPV